ncbi:hypothetical protein B0H13DRAFT_1883966 [Mycena leptocephala]|nr:hypothetical protein B0H13DRAFT_1883966 [Mycena leptocephala]
MPHDTGRAPVVVYYWDVSLPPRLPKFTRRPFLKQRSGTTSPNLLTRLIPAQRVRKLAAPLRVHAEKSQLSPPPPGVVDSPISAATANPALHRAPFNSGSYVREPARPAFLICMDIGQPSARDQIGRDPDAAPGAQQAVCGLLSPSGSQKRNRAARAEKAHLVARMEVSADCRGSGLTPSLPPSPQIALAARQSNRARYMAYGAKYFGKAKTNVRHCAAESECPA